MPKIKTGELMPNFVFQTPFEPNVELKDAVGQGKTAILFLRYYGCTLCQYDMKLLKDHYGEITEEGGNFMVVLQSDPEKMALDIDKDSFPYKIICDPDRTLYQMFQITPAGTKEELGGGNVLEKVARAREHFTHGDYEGDELQLPAVMVMDKNLKVLYVHYGTNAADVPGWAELAALLADTQGGEL